jgi:hypothetical protein
MPVSFHSSPRRSQQKHAAADTDSEPQEAKKTKRGQKTRGIARFNDSLVRKFTEEPSTTIRQKTSFDNPFPEQVDEMAAAGWIKARGLWKIDDSVPQQPVLEYVAYASPLDFLSYQC